MNTMESNENAGYEIGKGKPPKEHSWKAGQSGNPKGKLKGTIHSSTIINKWLEVKQLYKNTLNKKKRKITQLDIIVIEQLKKAKKGDVKSFNALLDRVEGRPVTPMEMDHKGDAFLEFFKMIATTGNKNIPNPIQQEGE